MKWVAGFGRQQRARPARRSARWSCSTTPATGLPVAILDGGPITAAADGRGLGRGDRAGSRRASTGRAPRAALIGAGVQGHSHLAGPRARPAGRRRCAIHDRDRERAAALAAAAAATAGHRRGAVAADARAAEATPMRTWSSRPPRSAPDDRQSMTRRLARRRRARRPGRLRDVLVAAEVARDAALFLVDERGQFLANRDAGQFDDYPDPTATIGEAILAGTPRPASGRVVVTHLGVGPRRRRLRRRDPAARRGRRARDRPAALSRGRPAAGPGTLAREHRAQASGRSACASPSASSRSSSSSCSSSRSPASGCSRGSRTARCRRRAATSQVPGLSAPVTRRPRRDRDRPHHRRLAPRPVRRPGLRPRAGADVADGGLAAHLGRSPVASCSARARSTRTASSGRSAGGRPPSATSRRFARRRSPSSTPTRPASTRGSSGTADRSAWPISPPGTTPEPWTTLDTVTWAKVQAWDLGGNLDSEIFRYLADARLGDPARTDALFPPYPEGAPVIDADRPGGQRRGRRGPGARSRDAPRTWPAPARPGRRRRRRPPGARSPPSGAAILAADDPRDARTDGLVGSRGIGSNDWVVGPAMSATGGALLANDPHLGVSMPSIWIINGLHCRVVSDACPYDVAGVSFPGAPGVVLGHNARDRLGRDERRRRRPGPGRRDGRPGRPRALPDGRGRRSRSRSATRRSA